MYEELSDAITPIISSVSSFLETNPTYKGIEELEVDYNLVEVSNGWYLDIQEKTFQKDVLDISRKGEISPRNFVYDCTIDPNPKE